jgi:nicotinamidase-related amidase
MVIVDCQKDFIDGALGTPEAQAMIPHLVEKIKNQKIGTQFIFTQDTHYDNYMETPEGKALPIPHCIKNTAGWEIDKRLTDLFVSNPFSLTKPTFGSMELIEYLDDRICRGDEIEFVGLCTDICVISNVLMAKAQFYNRAIISVDATCCAGVTPEKHAAALEVMKSCQIIVKE